MDLYFDRIKPLFESTGLTAKELAEKIGIPVRCIYNWNSKTNRVKSYRQYAFQIARYFNVSVEYILGETDDPAVFPAAGVSPEREAITDQLLSLDKDDFKTVSRLVVLLKNNPKATRSALDLALAALQAHEGEP